MDATHQVNALNTTDMDDGWGQVHNAVTLHAKQKAIPVRGAWDDDDDDDEADQLGETNAKELWEKANSSIPFPQIMHTSSLSMPVPPAAALQGPLRILKRPSATTSSNSLSMPQSNAQTRMSFEEREAQYQAARARIFGGDETTGGVAAADPTNTSRAPSPAPNQISNAKPKAKSPPLRSIVVRDPIGPGTSENTQGFSGRRKKRQEPADNKSVSPQQAVSSSSITVESAGNVGDWNG